MNKLSIKNRKTILSISKYVISIFLLLAAITLAAVFPISAIIPLLLIFPSNYAINRTLSILEMENITDTKLENSEINEILVSIKSIKDLQSKIYYLEDKERNLETKLQYEYEEKKRELYSTIEELEYKKDHLEKILCEEIDEKKLEYQSELNILEKKLINLKNDNTIAEQKLNELKDKVTIYEDENTIMEFGLYQPRYSFATSKSYKEKLNSIRVYQKEIIKNGQAFSKCDSFTLNGNPKDGQKVLDSEAKLMARAFNNETEAVINKLTYRSWGSSLKRINKSFEQINKLSPFDTVQLTIEFLNSKIDELTLAFEYELKKEEEKEILREEREKEREERALQREIQNKKKSVDKEIQHLSNVIYELKEKLKNAREEDKTEIESTIIDLEIKVDEQEESKNELDYREANLGAGYVYIVSNIGAFGEGIYKIGVTRRLDPYERIAELSSASVPFKYDVHAMIFSYKAYDLESKIHNIFNDKRVNLVNGRKEFFRVTLEDIEQILDEHKELSFELNKEAPAEEYRQTLKIIENQKSLVTI